MARFTAPSHQIHLQWLPLANNKDNLSFYQFLYTVSVIIDMFPINFQ